MCVEKLSINDKEFYRGLLAAVFPNYESTEKETKAVSSIGDTRLIGAVGERSEAEGGKEPEAFDGDPIGRNIKSENPFYCSNAVAAFYNALDPSKHTCESQCDKCKKVKDL